MASRRDSILKAAATSIARKGVRGLRVEDVAREAGVSLGLVYTGFGVPVAGVEEYEPELATDPVVSVPDEAIEQYEVAGPYEPEVARKRNKIYTEFKSA